MVVHSDLASFEAEFPGRALGSIKLVVEGEEGHIVDSTTYKLRPGKLLWVPAGMPMYSINGKKAEGICLYGGLDHSVLQEPTMFNLPTSFDKALHKLHTSLKKKENVVAAHDTLAQTWQDFIAGKQQAEQGLKLHRPGHVDNLARRLAHVRDWMQADCHLPLDNNRLADEACLSPFAFARRFREAFGTSPHDFIIEQRILRAQDLLLEQENTPLASIAEEVGYADLPTFSKAFRRKVGVPPSAWRLQLGTN
jgi:AraC-like DNA-binding protein